MREEKFVVKRQVPQTLDERVLRFIEVDELTRRLDLMLETQLRLAYLRGDIPPRSDQLFHTPYQYKDIGAGKSGRVFELKIPGDVTGGIITHIANNWFPNTYWEFEVDFEKVYESKVERKIAPVTEPKQVRILVREKIEARAYNDSTSDHTFEMLCDGYYIPLRRM